MLMYADDTISLSARAGAQPFWHWAWLALAGLAYVAQWGIRLAALWFLSAEALGLSRMGATFELAWPSLAFAALLLVSFGQVISVRQGTRHVEEAAGIPVIAQRSLDIVVCFAFTLALAWSWESSGHLVWNVDHTGWVGVIGFVSALGWLVLLFAPSERECLGFCGFHHARLALLSGNRRILDARPLPLFQSTQRALLYASIVVLWAAPAASIERVVVATLAAVLASRILRSPKGSKSKGATPKLQRGSRSLTSRTPLPLPG